MTLNKSVKKNNNELCGIFNIYKPVGITSFDVVRKVRKLTGEKKVGHCGTLDPEASGVLPVCVGKATKSIEFIMDNYKVYEAEIKLGVVTDTYDKEGAVLEQNAVNVLEEQVREAIDSFIGEIEQVPPMYSALKHNGKKLYELARAGIEVEREARKINIYDINVLSIDMPIVKILVKCSKGTYIRSLCYDIGRALGCGAMMWSLERHATGSFTKDKSINIEALNEENIASFLLPLEDAFKDFTKVIVDDKFEKLLLNGVNVKDRKFLNGIEDMHYYAVYNEKNFFIGIGYGDDLGFKLVKNFS